IAVDEAAWFEGRIGPGVDQVVHLVGDERPVALDAALEVHLDRVPGVTGKEFLDIVRDHAHRPASGLGKEIADRRVPGIPLAPNVAADIDVVKQELLLRYPSRSRQGLARIVGYQAAL